MDLQFSQYRLNCTRPFHISRSSFDHYDIFFVYLSSNGITGKGEAAPNSRYNEHPGDVFSALESIPATIDTPEDMDHGIEVMDNLAGPLMSLRSALICAFLDWYSQNSRTPIIDLLGWSSQTKIPKTSITIVIDDLDKIVDQLTNYDDFPILKIKLGTDYDQDIIRSIRNITDRVIRVDANEAWSLSEAMSMCDWLADKNVELVEQPLASDNFSEAKLLKEKSPIPIIADESCKTSADIEELSEAYDGINIKLIKCGGLPEAVRMIDTARKFKLKIMIGCMVESSLGITTAAHLGSLADFVDLDGHLLIKNDPYRGLKITAGQPTLPSGYGLGVFLDSQYQNNNLE
ncbi:MAG: dipeptide epimerase, partial [Candidatus Neomarinimicrobiota bacterium]